VNQSIHGEWWTADDPTSRFAGSLSLDDQPELSVFGRLTESIGASTPKGAVQTVSLIHGRATEGDRYTLVDSWQRGLRHLDGNVEREQLRPQATLRGAHLDGAELRFDRMLLWLDNLVALADDPSVDIDVDVGEGRWPQLMLVKAERQVVLDGRFDRERVQLVAAPEHSGGGQRTSLSMEVYFSVVPDEPAQWRDLIDGPASQLSDLTTLATTHPAAIRSVKLHSIAGSRSRDRVWVDLLLPFRRPQSRRDDDGWLASFQRLFSAEDAPDDVITRWGEVSKEYRNILPLVFAPSYAPFIYGEHRFVSVCQAVEALHDLVHDSRELPPDEHQARVDAALAADLPPEEAAWAEAVLRRANSLSFARKVERILAECPPVASQLDAQHLARSIAATRHPLSHGTLRRTGMLQGPDRHWTYEVLRFTVSWYLLVALVMPAGEASEKVGRHHEFRHAIGVLTTFQHGS
jgi:hypothetical protein